jgi:uncharacterized protein
MIPSRDECFLLLRRYEVPPHIIQHSEMVKRIALCLCDFLNREGERLNGPMVEAASLLHDIAKWKTLNTGESHAQSGAQIIQQLGFFEVGEIIRQHVMLDEERWDGPVSEAAVVYYADKRVKHTDIVSLDDRFKDLIERYGRTRSAAAWLRDLEKRCATLEAHLFQRLPIAPEVLTSLIR